MYPSTKNIEYNLPNRAEALNPLSCQECRRRKVKCSRQRPKCAGCINSSLGCAYPSGPLKPGPKPGRQRLRKRRIEQAACRQEMLDMELDTIYPTPNANTNAVHSDLSPTQLPVLPQGATAAGAPSFPFGLGTSINQCRQSSRSHSPDGPFLLNRRRLSWLVHPNHEPVSSVSEPVHNPMAKLVMVGEESLSIYGELLDKMGNALHTSGTDVNYLIGLYFDNMLAFNLFTTRLLAIKFQSASPPQLIALLAAMFSFSARFRSQNPSDNSGELASEDGARLPTANEFHDLAKRHVEKELLGLREPPPLVLLQAMVLISFHELTESAEGRGWRSLGLLVRIAFELRLHILDRDVDDASIWRDPELWSAMEERRRAWWAIWELDVFTSTVRRLPALIDWNENWTKLPVDDVCWIRKTPQRSCYLAADPMERFKLLEACGNKSAKAWFIIANSLMRTACCLSTSQEFFWTPGSLNPRRPGRESFAGQQPSLATIQNTHKILGNAVYCFSMALPDHLRYRGQHLFASAASASRATKQHDSHVYSIHVMIQLTEFMLHHCQVFGNACGETEHVLRTSQQGGSYSVFGGHEQEARYDMLGKQYLSAADKILSIVSTSAPDHVQLVNPLLASTIWLATAVFLVYSYLGISKNLAGEKLVVESNINLLKAVFRQFVAWWDMSNILEVKLAELEKHLLRMRDGDSSFENKDQMSCLDNDQQNTQSHIRGRGTDTLFRSRGGQPPLSQEETVVDDGYDMATSEVSPGRMETLAAGGASNMMTSRNTATLAHEPMPGLFEGDFYYDLELQGFVDSMFAAFRSGDD